MFHFLLRKLPTVLLVLWASSVIAFALPRLAPGDPAVSAAGPGAPRESVEAIRAELNLDQPVVQQYWEWFTGFLTGDFGTSFATQRPVLDLIGSRLASTVELALLATVIMVVIGVALGILAGSPRTPWARSVLDGANTLLLATPPFLTGLLLVLLLGIAFPVLPVSGEVSLLENPEIGIQYLILPALALALPQAAVVARLLQTSMLQMRNEEFVQLAVAKGVPPRQITARHVVRNSFGTAVVAIGIRLGELLGGAVVIEAIFSRSGVGALAVSSVQNRDYLVVQALIVLAILIAIATQLFSEIILAALDPRIRLGD